MVLRGKESEFLYCQGAAWRYTGLKSGIWCLIAQGSRRESYVGKTTTLLQDRNNLISMGRNTLTV